MQLHYVGKPGSIALCFSVFCGMLSMGAIQSVLLAGNAALRLCFKSSVLRLCFKSSVEIVTFFKNMKVNTH